MEKQNCTEIVFILDRSGSMAGLECDTIGGFNSMIKRQQAEPEGDVLVSTVLFNHDSKVLHDRVPLEKIEPLTLKEYEVGGMTALLDAVGDAIRHIKNVHKYAREEDRPQKTVFIITTDGMENASKWHSYAEVKRLINQQKEKGWEFIFLGANLDAAEVADHIGIDASRAVNYHSDEIGTQKIYGAMSHFIMESRTMRGSRPGNDWRKDIDEDFDRRKRR